VKYLNVIVLISLAASSAGAKRGAWQRPAAIGGVLDQTMLAARSRTVKRSNKTAPASPTFGPAPSVKIRSASSQPATLVNGKQSYTVYALDAKTPMRIEITGEGKLQIASSTQNPHYLHRQLARVLQVPEARISVVATPNGGGFGGKCDPGGHEFVVSKAALVLGRPVKVGLTREEVFYVHRGRHPVLMKMKTGVTRDGKLTGMHLQTLLDGGGYGSHPATHARFQQDSRTNAETIRKQGMARFVGTYGVGAARVQFQNKDPRGWQEFATQLAGHSTEGSARTMRGVQARRPSLFDLVEKMKDMTTPTLIMTGDEDWPCLEPALLMKRTIPTAALVVMPNAGHTINLEDPVAFNQHIADFLHTVDVGSWRKRDPRAMISAILGR
jgi:hypothetical protein